MSYSRGFRKAFHADPAVFSYFDIKDILVAGNGLAVALEDGTVRAGVYYACGVHKVVSREWWKLEGGVISG